MPSKKVVDLTNARTKQYQKVLEKISQEGRCPFCPENFKYHPKPILKRRSGWFITSNTWPYDNAKHHFLIISQIHKENLSELTRSDWQAVHQLACWTVERFRIPGGALLLRFGDTCSTGATVCHLHFHLITPKISPRTKRSYTVNFPIG